MQVKSLDETAIYDIGHAFGRSLLDEFSRRLGESIAGAEAQQHRETGGA